MNYLSSIFGESSVEDPSGNNTAGAEQNGGSQEQDEASVLRAKRLKKLEVSQHAQKAERPESGKGGEGAAPLMQVPVAKVEKKVSPPPAPQAKAPSPPSVLSPSHEKPVRKKAKKTRDDNDILSSVFQVTIDGSQRNKPSFVFLEDLSETLNEQASEAKLTGEHIDAILYARLSFTPCTVSPIKYLAECYARAIEEGRHGTSNAALLESSKTYIVNFMGTVFENPEIFPSTNAGQFSHVTDSLFGTRSFNASFELLSKVLENFSGEEDIKVGIFNDLFQDAMKELGKHSGSPGNAGTMSFLNSFSTPQTATILHPFSATLDRLKHLIRLPYAVETVWKLDLFSLRVNEKLMNGQQMEFRTLLGNILRIGTCGGMPLFGNSGGGRVEAAVAKQYFQNPRRRTFQDIQSSMSMLRNQVQVVVAAAQDFIKRMLIAKKAPDAKEAVQRWISEALKLSKGRSKERPNPLTEVHDSFAINMSNVLFRLSEPFTKMKLGVGWTKMKLIDVQYCSSPEMLALYGDQDGNPVVTVGGNNGGGDENKEKSGQGDSEKSESFNFVTRCFFFAAQSQHLGLVVAARNANLFERHLNHIHGTGNMIMFDNMLSLKFARDVQICDPSFLLQSLDFVTFTARFLYHIFVSGESATGAVGGGLKMDKFPPSDPCSSAQRVPVHLVEDIADVLLFIAKVDPGTVTADTNKLNIILSFISVVLKVGEKYFPSPHLRAKFGDLLLFTFVPAAHRGMYKGNTGNPTGNDSFNTAGTASLLSSNPLALDALAPALLALYGDVEQTGFYDKTDHRLKISYVLKYLWTFPGHKSSIRKAATQNLDGNSDGSAFSFVSFANGIMNQSNSLISDSLGKLQSIKKVQEEMSNTAAWMAKPEDERKHEEEKMKEEENHVRSSLMMANETLDMLAYLTAEIQSPFLVPELLKRLASTLNSVLVKLAGRGGLQLKVANPAKYHFKPKEMIVQIVKVYLNMGKKTEFLEEVAVEFAEDFYEEGIFDKAGSILRRLSLLNPADLERWSKFTEQVVQAVLVARETDQFMDDAPNEFLDPLLCDVMRNPVQLPSGNIMDLTSIKQHLLNDEHDPFTREKLTLDDVKPVPALKEKIDKWIASERAKAKLGKRVGSG